jgi:hypothetical protein
MIYPDAMTKKTKGSEPKVPDDPAVLFIRLDQKLYQRLKERCERDGRTIKKTVERMLTRFLES